MNRARSWTATATGSTFTFDHLNPLANRWTNSDVEVT